MRRVKDERIHCSHSERIKGEAYWAKFYLAESSCCTLHLEALGSEENVSETEMAAKCFSLFVAVLVLFEAEAALYRRVFDGPGSPFMRGK